MAKQVVVYKLTGVKPMLCNNPASMKQSTGEVGGQTVIPTPEVEAKSKVYLNAKGQFCFPVIAVRNCIVQAAKSSRLKFGKIAASQVISASCFPAEEFVPILDPETGNPISKYEIDIRTVVIKNGAKLSRVHRARPRFDKWMLRVPFEINDSLAATIVDGCLKIMNIAGEIVGIGDFRVSKGGFFGQFTAEVEK